MKLSDLRYITQENIDEAHINITSPDMYTEVREYNINMLRMRRKKYIFLCDFWAMLVLNLLIVPVLVLYSLDLPLTLLRMAEAPLWLHFVLPLVFWGMFGYFWLYRRLTDWRVMLVISAVMIPDGILFVITTAANTFITWYMRKTDEQIKADVGFPEFVELKTTYIREEVEEQMSVYAKSYIKPPEDDDSLLFNNDISRSDDDV
ncbi:MAG: hypothetical protein IKO47_03905 [Ruminococcus sp.]|nr:hypothetical protein [Ruminococcus sp.]